MTELKVDNRLKETYDSYYQNDDPEWRRLGALEKVANIVALCERLPHRTVLEIGAGDGAILERLADIGFGERLFATEISASGVEAIRKRGIPRMAGCELFDGYQLPFGDGEFDLVVLSHVVEHVEHPRQLLREASRVGRYLFVEVPLEDMSRLRDDFKLDRVGHINFFSPRTIRWLVQSCGLRVMRQTTTNPSKATYTYHGGKRGLINYHIKQVLLAALPRLATRHFTYHGSLVCEKTDDP